LVTDNSAPQVETFTNEFGGAVGFARGGFVERIDKNVGIEEELTAHSSPLGKSGGRVERRPDGASGIERCCAAGICRVLLKPLAKCRVQSLMFGPGHESGLLDEVSSALKVMFFILKYM
jgi:hypothetical protein